MGQQKLTFNGPSTVTINNFQNGDGHYVEPYTEPITIKLTETQKKQLIEHAKKEGYTSLSLAARDLMALGLEFYPLRNRTILDVARGIKSEKKI